MTAEGLWQSILDKRRAAVLEGLDAFRAELFDLRVRFGDRSLCNHLRPKFLTESELAELESTSAAVMAGILQAKERLLEDPAMLDLLGLTEIEREFVAVDPGFERIAPNARLDSFITADGPQFVELNGECPAGVGYSEVLGNAFLDHPVAAEFGRRAELRLIPTLQPMLDTLLACWAEFGGFSTPTIAIVDFADVPTRFEFEICRDYFRAQGYRTIVCDPRELEYDGSVMRAQGEKIDLVYKRVLMNDCIARFDEVKHLWHAYRDGTVCVVNPFRSKLVHKKAIFAVLTDDRRDEWLAPEQRELIDRAVPWTRKVERGKTRLDGEIVDLIPHLERHREDFVLKPNDDYGGKGITLGWEVDDERWSAALNAAIGRDFVVQKRLRMLAEEFPAIGNGLENEKLFVDLDPFMFMGQMHGALARLGVGGLCNVTSGGGQVPVMIVADEKEIA